MLPFPFKTEPRAHQLEEFNISRALEPRALFWEMGCGKTKPVLDTAAELFQAREITGMLVLAPPGVHENWIYDEIPKHLNDRVAEATRSLVWQTKKAKTNFMREQFKGLLAHEGFSVLAMTYNSLMTDAGATAAKAFLKQSPRLYVADEATAFSRPGTKTAKRVLASSAYARWKRVLNGTPVADSPFQAYSQVKFVSPDAWKDACGISNYEHFKHHFGIWRRAGGAGASWPQLVRYRELDEMRMVMDSVGSRLLKADVLDLPPKSYQKIYFDLSPAQRRMYDRLRDDMRAEFSDGSPITADLAIVQLTRLQQIASGWAPADEESELRKITEDGNPRIAVLRELLQTIPGKAIIWGKYDIDVDEISQLCRTMKLSYVVYDGRTEVDDRQAAKRAFQDGGAQFFVAKPRAAGRGLTLTAATTVVYYNNGYSLDDRLQSEDRAHRFGQEHPVMYFDIVGRDTVDEKIVEALVTKRSVASLVTGDKLSDWI